MGILAVLILLVFYAEVVGEGRRRKNCERCGTGFLKDEWGPHVPRELGEDLQLCEQLFIRGT